MSTERTARLIARLLDAEVSAEFRPARGPAAHQPLAVRPRPASDAVRTGEPLARPIALNHPGRPGAHAPALSNVRSLDVGEPREPASCPRRGSL